MKNIDPDHVYPSRKGMGARMLVMLLAALLWRVRTVLNSELI